jgi:hypothetical protein
VSGDARKGKGHPQVSPRHHTTKEEMKTFYTVFACLSVIFASGDSMLGGNQSAMISGVTGIIFALLAISESVIRK